MVQLNKWDIIRAKSWHTRDGHSKYCICLDPNEKWFLFINSNLPEFPCVKEYAVLVLDYKQRCLSKTSYIDISLRDDGDIELDDLTEDDVIDSLMPTFRSIVEKNIKESGLYSENRLQILGL